MANKTLGLSSGTKTTHTDIQRTKVRRNISTEFVRGSFAEEEPVFPKTDDLPKTTESVAQKRTLEQSPPAERREYDLPKTDDLPKTPVSFRQFKNPPLSQRRTGKNARGEESRRFDIYLSGKDKKNFEDLVERMSKMMPQGKKIKNNDVIRAMIPTFLRIVKYVNKSEIPQRPGYGTREYRAFIDKLGELIWDATIIGITTEAQRYGLEETEYDQLKAYNG